MREAEQQRIIGAVLQVVRDNPVIPARYLSGSSAQENAELHLLVERVPMEQMLKIWNNTSKDYKLSFSLMLTGVTINSRVERRVPRVTEVTIGTRVDDRRGGAR